MEVLQPFITSGVIKIVADQWVDNWDPAKAEIDDGEYPHCSAEQDRRGRSLE